jgi:HNH endonuclease
VNIALSIKRIHLFLFSHQVDHLISLKHDGQTVSVNLALACLDYNRYKGSDLAVLQVE